MLGGQVRTNKHRVPAAAHHYRPGYGRTLALLNHRTYRGVSLGGTMLAVAVLSLLAAALASLSINHIRLTGRAQHGRLAANAARSAVSLAVSQLLEQPEYGTVRLAGETLRYQGPGSLGVVTFHETTARDEGVRLSTNNLEGTHDIEGDGGDLVPSGTVEISAVGRSGGSERPRSLRNTSASPIAMRP